MFNPTRRAQFSAHHFNISGRVTEILRGCAAATVVDGYHREISVNKGTQGIHFDKLMIGQMVNCDVAADTGRVLHAHQQTQPARMARDLR